MTQVEWYRKRAVEIPAVCWDGNPETIDAFFDALGTPVKDRVAWGSPGSFLMIRTLEGDMRCEIGDWIIRGVAGEFYPCKPTIFEQTYEPVEVET